MSKHKSKLEEIKAALWTALAVVVGMELFIEAIRPYLHLLIVLLVAVTVGLWLYKHSRHL